MPAAPIDRVAYSRALAVARGGDFAHPGGADAINRVADLLGPRDSELLDFGCGLGGTARHLQGMGWARVVGIDVDEPSIAYAREHHRSVSFISGTIEDHAAALAQRFGSILAMNVFYLLPDKLGSLTALRQVARDRATLVIFDYTYDEPSNVSSLTVRGSRLFPRLESKAAFEQMLGRTGWRVEESRSLRDEYANWYRLFLEQLALRREEVERWVGADGFGFMVEKYTAIGAALDSAALGGLLMRAVAS